MGYTHSMQASVTVFDVQEKRKEWKKTIQPDMVDHLVFLDESGVNTNLTRLYGRAPSSQRAVDHATLNTPQTTTVLSSHSPEWGKGIYNVPGWDNRGTFCSIFERDLASDS